MAAKSLGNEGLRRQRDGDLVGAFAAYERAVALDPRDPELLMALAELASRLERYELATQFWAQLSAAYPHAPEIVDGHAHALIAASRFADAIDLLKSALQAETSEPRLWTTLGLALTYAGRAAEALAFFDEAIRLAPNLAGGLLGRGLARYDLGRSAEAEADFRAAGALARNAGERAAIDGALAIAARGLGRAKERQGDDRGAVAFFRLAAQWLPGLAPIFNDLGVSLHRLGQRDEALAALDRAISIDPAYAVAHGNRGVVLFDLGRFGEAFDAQLAALDNTSTGSTEKTEIRASALENLLRAACKAGRLAEAGALASAQVERGNLDAIVVDQLALILDRSNRPDEARALRNDFLRRTGVKRSGRVEQAEATVLLLTGVGGGHVPIRYLVDPHRFAALSVGLLSPDQPDAPLGAVDVEALSQVDVVFNTLADVDHDGGQFAAASAICTSLGKPVLNPPSAVLRTGRAHAPALFFGIAGLVTPATWRSSPDELAGLTILAPLLVRPAGDHGGDNLVLLRDDADKRNYLSAKPEDNLYLTAFHDFRSTDGLWRKYRLIFVDRHVYPYHLAIGDHWRVHYWRAEMGRSDWKQSEEERFLADWRNVFGAEATAAVEEVARRLDLDYGGMDCALTADGGVVLFEANACILVHLDEPAARFPYKHRYVPGIREAFSQMLLNRARGSVSA